ncbi:MAG: undecaprenyl-diphosphate phosphatase [Verrucomicrobiae bacterium]|nr:undecaprenyl-diphosphate phosphatase [Verrucomicrobiae bacterium]
MPDWLAVVLLGIIEGLTEFIPVSSTGHLLLAERWLPRQSDLFNIVIQCGAVLAVLPLFPERLRQFVALGRDPATRDYLLKIAVAFALTAAPGLVLDRLGFKLPETVFPVALALVLGGVLFLVVEAWLRGRPLRSEISWSVVVAVAAGQLIAGVFPGTSRSGATILLALMLGVARPAATEFSFLVGIPTMLSAGGWKIFKALRHEGAGPSEDWGLLVLGTVVAAAVSFVAVRWLLRYVQTHTFVLFGWYRIVLGVVLLAFL